MSELAGSLGEARRMVKGLGGGGWARRLEALGLGLVLIPDPALVTYLAGALLWCIGRARRGGGLAGLGRATRSLLRDLEDALP